MRDLKLMQTFLCTSNQYLLACLKLFVAKFQLKCRHNEHRAKVRTEA